MIRRSTIALVLAALAIAATATAAAGFAVGRVYQLHKGDRADLTIDHGFWACFNTGAKVSCQSGDAFRFVDLTGSRRGVTVVVHALKDPQAGRLVRTTDRYGNGVYTFTAMP